MSAINDLLRCVEAAEGDLHAQAAIAAEFLVSTRPEPEREPLRVALDAAAVVHWFNDGLLAQLLAISEEDARSRMDSLIRLPFIERYRNVDGAGEIHNVHESTRLGWRIRLATESPEYFRGLCSRAAACFSSELGSIDRVEWMYHVICADPERGADELEALQPDWRVDERPEDNTLTTALQELIDTRIICKRALLWTQLTIGWAHQKRADTEALATLSDAALLLARQLADRHAEADAQCLLGDAADGKGYIDEAYKAYMEYREICRQLVSKFPKNNDYRWDLAVAHSRIGNVLEKQGQEAGWNGASNSYTACLRIFQRLVAKNPDNANWRRNLGASHGLIGNLQLFRGKLKEAKRHLAKFLEISRELAAQDTHNAAWQRDVAMALRCLGDASMQNADLDAAQRYLQESLAISQRLADADRNNAAWLVELASARFWVGHVWQAKGLMDPAREFFTTSLAAYRQLAEQDRAGADWQRNVALTCARLGQLDTHAGELHRALSLYDEAAEILRKLTEHSPDVVQWTEDRKTIDAAILDLKCQIQKSE